MSLKIFLGIAGAIAIPLALFLLASKVHMAKIKTMVQEFPLDKHFELLSKIDQFSPDISTGCLLIDSGRKMETTNYLGTDSYVGGTPYIEKGDTQRLEPDYEFLMQFKVPVWIPSSFWQGDLFTVFVNDIHVKCFRYADPQLEKTSHNAKKFAQTGAAILTEVRIPRIPHGQKFRNIYNPRLLLSKIPDLRTALPSDGKKPEQFLAALLGPASGYDFEMFDRIQVGGAPHWVQSPEIPKCNTCEKRMKFIAQVGQCASLWLIKKQREDVIYIFGCKEHLENIEAVTQFT